MSVKTKLKMKNRKEPVENVAVAEKFSTVKRIIPAGKKLKQIDKTEKPKPPKVMRFRLLVGKVYLPVGDDIKEYVKDDIIETTLNLTKLHGRLKFRRLADQPTPTDVVIPEVVPDDDIEEEDEETLAEMKPKKKKGRGVLVTKQFDLAVENDLKVFKRRIDKRFDIYNTDDMKMNKKSLRRREVEPFINTYLENQDNIQDEESVEDDDE